MEEGLTVVNLQAKRKRLSENQKRWYHKAKAENKESYVKFRKTNKQNSVDRSARLHSSNQRSKRTGERILHLQQQLPETIEAAKSRIENRTMQAGECMECTYAMSTSGYPEISVNGKHVLAAAVILIHSASPVSHLLEVSHLCHNKRCVRRDHLTWETHSENTKRNFEGYRLQKDIVTVAAHHLCCHWRC